MNAWRNFRRKVLMIVNDESCRSFKRNKNEFLKEFRFLVKLLKVPEKKHLGLSSKELLDESQSLSLKISYGIQRHAPAEWYEITQRKHS